jgi:hypothetical protein
MNALPLLLIGGAAVVLLSGKKRSRSTSVASSRIVEEGSFTAGELWRLVRLPSSPDPRGGEAYTIEADLEMMGNWVTLQEDGVALVFSSPEEARDLIRKLAESELLVDEQGVVSA